MPQNETHCECLFVTVILTKMKLHYPEMKYPKVNICSCNMQIIYKNKDICSKYQNRNRFHFIRPKWKLIWTEFFTWRNVILVWVLCKHPLGHFPKYFLVFFFLSAKVRFLPLLFLNSEVLFMLSQLLKYTIRHDFFLPISENVIFRLEKKKNVSKLKNLSLRIMQFNLQYNYERRLLCYKHTVPVSYV